MWSSEWTAVNDQLQAAQERLAGAIRRKEDVSRLKGINVEAKPMKPLPRSGMRFDFFLFFIFFLFRLRLVILFFQFRCPVSPLSAALYISFLPSDCCPVSPWWQHRAPAVSFEAGT